MPWHVLGREERDAPKSSDTTFNLAPALDFSCRRIHVCATTAVSCATPYDSRHGEISLATVFLVRNHSLMGLFRIIYYIVVVLQREGVMHDCIERLTCGFLASGKLGGALLQERLQHVQHLYERVRNARPRRDLFQRYVEQGQHLCERVSTGERDQTASNAFLVG